MNSKLFFLFVLFVHIQFIYASSKAKFIFVEDDEDSIMLNKYFDDEDNMDIALKGVKELNFNESKLIKLAGEDRIQSICLEDVNLCEFYKGRLIKCMNSNYETENEPDFRCYKIGDEITDQNLEILNPIIECNNPTNQNLTNTTYIRTPCSLQYQLKFKEDDKDIAIKDIKELNFYSSKIVKLGNKELNQTKCIGKFCDSIDIKFIKCKLFNCKDKNIKCEIMSPDKLIYIENSYDRYNRKTREVYIDSPVIKCNPSLSKTPGNIMTPCIIKYKLEIKQSTD